MDNDEGMLREGIAAFETMNYTKTLALLMPLAEKGIAEAQCIIGSLYQIGLGVQVSWEEAVRWYLKAAEQGHALACNNLGCIYSVGGVGIAMDKVKARMFYERAAELGFPMPMNNIG
jgi:TPR repeat protein